MPSQPLVISLPPNLDLWEGCTVRVTAVNPTTGAGVTGVGVQQFNLEVTTDNPSELEYGPFVLVTGPSG